MLKLIGIIIAISIIIIIIIIIIRLLKSYHPYEGPLPDPTTTSKYNANSDKKRVGALPSYAVPGLATRVVMSNSNSISVNMNSTITPLGSSVVTPFDEAKYQRNSNTNANTNTFNTNNYNDTNTNTNTNTTVYGRIIDSFTRKIEKSFESKRGVFDQSSSLLSRFQEFDRNSTGFISLVLSLLSLISLSLLSLLLSSLSSPLLL